MDLYEHMGKDLFRAQGIPTPAGRVCRDPGGGGRRGPRLRRLGGRQGPGAGRRSRQGWRRRALPVTGGRRRRGRAHAPRRVQGQPGGPRPGRGVAADLGGVLHLDRARSEHRGLPRDDDRRRRGGHRDARPRASGGDPACPDRSAARPSHLPPPPAHRSAAGSGARRARPTSFGSCSTCCGSATRPWSRSTRSCSSPTAA